MASPTVAWHGSWRSPITAELASGLSVGLSDIRIDADTIYWTESRPTEGRTVLLQCAADGTIRDCTLQPFNGRSLVHDYDGMPYVIAQGRIYFSDRRDQHLYRLDACGGTPVQFATTPNARYSDGCYDDARQRLIFVREISNPDPNLVENAIVGLPLSNPSGEATLVPDATGDPRREFYAAPRVSPDGQQLAWIFWQHPDMPWTHSTLWVGTFDSSGALSAKRSIAGGPGVSVLQPEWSSTGELYYLSNESGWWNLYRWDGHRSNPVTQLTDAEIGAPLWNLGASYYGFAANGEIVCAFNRASIWSLGVVARNGALRTLSAPFQHFASVKTLGNDIVCIAGAPDRPRAVVRIDILTGNSREVRASAVLPAALAPYISAPTTLTLGGAQGLYYPPRNPDFAAPTGEKPPLIVNCHGGPTAAAYATLNLLVQFWTSRGFAYLELNYRGSNGFGRDYLNALKENWGVVDVEDAKIAAQELVKSGRADRDRLIIRGGSAGGYTALAALAFTKTFQAGGSYYGIGDLVVLLDTHKFEMHYLDWLVGDYPAQAQRYHDRSPIFSADQITSPVIFLQGEDDPIVKPVQSEGMAEALRTRGIPYSYLLFAGESHGFRKAATNIRALEAELDFYATVLTKRGLRN